jgi:hypothetical protein
MTKQLEFNFEAARDRQAPDPAGPDEAVPAEEYIPRPLRRPAALAYVVVERLLTPLLSALMQANPAQLPLYGWTRKPKILVANYAWAEH